MNQLELHTLTEMNLKNNLGEERKSCIMIQFLDQVQTQGKCNSICLGIHK